MDLRRKAQRCISVICCTVFSLFAVQVPARLDAVSAQSAPEEGAGQTLAYIGSDGNIWLTAIDGTGQRRLTDISEGLTVLTPDWCPDGERIVYDVVNQTTGQNWCQMVDIHGTDLGRVPTAGGCDTPACRDGKIVFHAYRRPCSAPGAGSGQCSDIYVADLDTGQVTRVTDQHHNMFADWSPDGAQIAYWSYRGDETSGIYILDADTSGERLAVPTGGGTSHVSWSPTGKEVAFWVSTEGLVIAKVDEAEVAHVPGLDWSSWDSSRIGWSMDGTSIAVSNSEGVWVKDLTSGDIQKIATGHRPAWQPQPKPTTVPSCGTWDGSVSDERMELTRISEAAGDECRGAFLFSNETSVSDLDLGGYALEFQVTRLDNANVEWLTLPAEGEGMESMLLFPSLDREVHSFPVNVDSEAEVLLQAEATVASLTADAALFLLQTALTLAPGGSGLIPEEELAYAVIRVSHIVTPAVRLAWEGDLIGAGEELQQLLPEFLERSSAALKEIGIDCGAEALKSLIGKPAVIARLGIAYLTWIPKVFYDYLKYQGRPVYATLVYESPTPDPLASRDVVWSEARRIDEGSSGAAYQLLADREGYMWAFWEEHLPGSTPEHFYDAVHYRIWSGDRWGSIQDILGSENMGEQRAVLLPDGSILVKADDLNQQVRKWFLWDGSHWSAVPDMSLPLSQQESGQRLGIDGQGKVHILGVPARIWDGANWRETGSLSSGVFHSGAIDTEEDLHVVAHRPSLGDTGGIEHWTWDGDSWAAPKLAYTFPEESPMFAAPPALAIDPDGTFHLVWGGRFRQPQQPPKQPSLHWLTYHRGDGDLWSQPQTLYGPVKMEGGSWWADVDVWSDGLVVAAWGGVKTESGEAVYVIWGNEGNWVEPVMLSPDDGNYYREPDVEIDATGLVHVIWSTPTGGIYHVIGSRSGSLPASP